MEWLEERRKTVGMTMRQVGIAAEISESMYSLIEAGERKPSVATAKRIANVLQFEWTRFFED